MRMWMVNPRLMCRRHLLGEHVELHMLAASLRRGISLSGYIEKRLVELHNIGVRHARLVKELERRGYRHRSPLTGLYSRREGRVDRRGNLRELAARCAQCRLLQRGGGWENPEGRRAR